jgi:hypothetical protein
VAVAQSKTGETEHYGFQDTHLGMSLIEFKAKHPASKIATIPRTPPPCAAEAGEQTGSNKSERAQATFTRCFYNESYLGIRLRINAMFVGGHLAFIEIEPPLDSVNCFLPPPPAGTSALPTYQAFCQQSQQLLQELTSNLGPPTPIASTAKKWSNLQTSRWENSSSVGEFQYYMCIPWDGTKMIWSKMVSDALDGTYCAEGDLLMGRQPAMLYVDKKLGQDLITVLTK